MVQGTLADNNNTGENGREYSRLIYIASHRQWTRLREIKAVNLGGVNVSLASAFAINCPASTDDSIVKALIWSVFVETWGPRGPSDRAFSEKKFWRACANPIEAIHLLYWYLLPLRSTRFIFAFFVIFVKSIQNARTARKWFAAPDGRGPRARGRVPRGGQRRRETPLQIPKEAVGGSRGSIFSRPAVVLYFHTSILRMRDRVIINLSLLSEESPFEENEWKKESYIGESNWIWSSKAYLLNILQFYLI